ncbi:hypothetical protein AB0I22_33095 [Streptomyces sp. NPDC050610]|uniref:hypothetical protein n=1 Tax=Streptomyces sp. NPDC050610 TaxID=3157097 RepID=UPI003413B02E
MRAHKTGKAHALLAEGTAYVEALRADPALVDGYPYPFLLLIAPGGAAKPADIFWGVAALEARGWSAESWDMADAVGAWRVVMRRASPTDPNAG